MPESEMPLFKAWDSQRSTRKSVFANSLEEFVSKSAHKLELKGNVRVFLEDDGTEIDDDDCFLALKESTVLVVGSEWHARSINSTVTAPLGSKQSDSTDQSDPAMDIDTSGIDDISSLATEEAGEEKISEESPSTSQELGSPNAFDVLTSNAYKNAKMKGLKIYKPSEINSSKSDLEKMRRQFWNDKAEQLCKDPKTSKLDKTVLYGMVDVSWTLRKSGILEADARKLQHEEDVLFQRGDAACSGKRKLGTQKKGTIPKNIDRMGIAHLEVESLDTALMDARSRFGLSITKEERSRCQREYKEKSTLLDGAYSELKRAQDALSKSMTQKKAEIENALKEKDDE